MVAIAWSFGAVWFDAPFGNANKVAAGILAIGFAIAFAFVRRCWRRMAAVALLFGGVLAWWLTLSPTNNSDWQPDVAKEAWADIKGDQVTFHNVRNCDYRSETDYISHWGDAHGAYLADHPHRRRGQLLGFALDRASHSQLPIR
jgi:hypothetical protein